MGISGRGFGSSQGLMGPWGWYKCRMKKAYPTLVIFWSGLHQIRTRISVRVQAKGSCGAAIPVTPQEANRRHD